MVAVLPHLTITARSPWLIDPSAWILAAPLRRASCFNNLSSFICLPTKQGAEPKPDPLLFKC